MCSDTVRGKGSRCLRAREQWVVRRLWGGHPRGRLELGQAGAHEETAASGVTLVRRAMHGDLWACGFCSFAPHLTASAGR